MTHIDFFGNRRPESLDELKKIYRSLSPKYHPDTCGNLPNSAQLFQDLKDAYKYAQHILITNADWDVSVFSFDGGITEFVSSPPLIVDPKFSIFSKKYSTTPHSTFACTIYSDSSIFRARREELSRIYDIFGEIISKNKFPTNCFQIPKISPLFLKAKNKHIDILTAEYSSARINCLSYVISEIKTRKQFAKKSDIAWIINRLIETRIVENIAGSNLINYDVNRTMIDLELHGLMFLDTKLNIGHNNNFESTLKVFMNLINDNELSNLSINTNNIRKTYQLIRENIWKRLFGPTQFNVFPKLSSEV